MMMNMSDDIQRLKPRKQPVQRRAQASMQAILQAAAQLLQREGMDAFNTNLIAQRAGVSIGTLYQYFPDKHAIAAALSREMRANLLAQVATAVATLQEADLEHGLAVLIQTALAGDMATPRYAKALDLLEAHLPLAEESLRSDREMTEVVAVFLERYAAGHTRTEIMVMADELRAMVSSLTTLAVQQGRAVDEGFVVRLAKSLAAVVRVHWTAAR